MTNCAWEKIESFQSPMEFRRFLKWIEHQKSEGLCTEMYGDVKQDAWADRYFVCTASREIWVLRQPDPGYFAGSWLPVRTDLPPS